MVAEDARLHGLGAERMLVALKTSWAGPEEVPRLQPHDARELLARLVSLSIRAYYAGDPPPVDTRERRRTSAA